MNMLRMALKVLIPILSFGFLGSELFKLTEKLGNSSVHINPTVLAISTALLIGIFLADAKGWHLILTMTNQKLAAGKAFYIWFYSSFCRYIPGVIWPYLTRIELSKSVGIDRETTITSMMLENLLLAGTSLALAAPVIFLHLGVELQEAAISVAPFALAGSGIALFFAKTVLSTNLAKKYLSSLCAISKSSWILLIVYYTAFWLIFGFVFMLFATSTIQIKHEALLLVALSFPISFAIGFIASISPGGLGIREGVLYSLLSLQLASEDAAFLAITSRAWLMSVELLIAACLAAGHIRKKVTSLP